MMNTNDTPKTLLEAVKFFSDYENCRSSWSRLGGLMDGHCPTCGSDHVTYMAKHAPLEVLRASMRARSSRLRSERSSRIRQFRLRSGFPPCG